eukprot:TRINITY_DN3589_c0_g1_i1.p1 TRINITY_DN3589_c0_g1~~TRINITY_DN3589_c0_g1_i1.p1  ORF type:complete len:287 (+),score=114.47 TRINITY_DN3589_c0_g1_i1:62-922(+)
MAAPPPPPSMLPPMKAAKKSKGSSNSDITSMLGQKVDRAAEEPDLEAHKLVTTDILPKIVCPRCEQKLLEDEYPSHKDAHSSEIIPCFLFLGSMQNAHNKKELTVRTGITDILNLAEEVENVFEKCREGCVCCGGGVDCNGSGERPVDESVPLLFKYHTFRIKDRRGENIYPLFDELYELLKEIEDSEEPRRVLVHCVQGISRSSSIVMAYLMRSRRWSLRKACEHVRSERGVAKPIRFFLSQLQLYEEHLGKQMELDGYDGKTPSLDVLDLYDPSEIMIGDKDIS